MKKGIWLLLLLVILTGCSSEETMETIYDVHIQPVDSVMKQAALNLPEGAAVSVMQGGDNGILYFCDEYTITLQTVPSGDLNGSFQTTTGYTKDRLNPIHTVSEGVDRYECVWTCAGEGEEQVGRMALLDDGSYHYILTCMTGQSTARELQETWNALFSSFCLTVPGEDLYTGS